MTLELEVWYSCGRASLDFGILRALVLPCTDPFCKKKVADNGFILSHWSFPARSVFPLQIQSFTWLSNIYWTPTMSSAELELEGLWRWNPKELNMRQEGYINNHNAVRNEVLREMYGHPKQEAILPSRGIREGFTKVGLWVRFWRIHRMHEDGHAYYSHVTLFIHIDWFLMRKQENFQKLIFKPYCLLTLTFTVCYHSPNFVERMVLQAATSFSLIANVIQRMAPPSG